MRVERRIFIAVRVMTSLIKRMIARADEGFLANLKRLLEGSGG